MNVDIKKSSYKKLSKLLSTFEKKASPTSLLPRCKPIASYCS